MGLVKCVGIMSSLFNPLGLEMLPRDIQMWIISRAWISKDVKADLGVISIYVVVTSIKKTWETERTLKDTGE